MFLKKLGIKLAFIFIFFTMARSINAAEFTVEIKGMEFSPKILTIAKGDTVIFINKDTAAHTASATDGSFESGELTKGKSEEITFEKSGRISYYCMFHPSMNGEIIVK